MSFKNLEILFLLIFMPFIMAIGYYFFFKREKEILLFFKKENFEKIGVKRSKGKAFLRWLLISLIYGCFVVALAGPQYGFKEITLNTLGNNIFIAIDTSLSMRAQDVKPSRIELAKRKIIDFIDNLKGERVALVPFAGEPYMLIPLTSDYSIFKEFVDMIDTDIIPVPGTNFYNLIEKVISIVEKYNLGNVSLLILTDGENFSGDIDKAISKCKKFNIKIFSIGIGDTTPVPIPLKNGGFKKDRNNNLVTTKLNEKFLEKISLNTGGVYIRGVETSRDVGLIYKKISKYDKYSKGSIMTKRIYYNRFYWFLIPSFLMFVFYFFIDERWRI